jgi:GNAT superfamily N-acetyltransferase
MTRSERSGIGVIDCGGWGEAANDRIQNPGHRRPVRGDLGIVAVVNGADAGACWMRVLPEGVGLASIDDTTPQLGIALEPRYQRRGLGEPLMREALGRAWQAGHEKVSLTVHPENPAIPLYERCGFGKVEIRRGYHLMVAIRP